MLNGQNVINQNGGNKMTNNLPSEEEVKEFMEKTTKSVIRLLSGYYENCKKGVEKGEIPEEILEDWKAIAKAFNIQIQEDAPKNS